MTTVGPSIISNAGNNNSWREIKSDSKSESARSLLEYKTQNPYDYYHECEKDVNSKLIDSTIDGTKEFAGNLVKGTIKGFMQISRALMYLATGEDICEKHPISENLPKSSTFNLRPKAEASSIKKEENDNNIHPKDKNYNKTMELMRKYGGRVNYKGGPWNN